MADTEYYTKTQVDEMVSDAENECIGMIKEVIQSSPATLISPTYDGKCLYALRPRDAYPGETITDANEIKFSDGWNIPPVEEPNPEVES